MDSQEKYGVLIIGGNRSHQEGYSRTFAADPRCRLIASSDERDAPLDRVELNRALAEELDIPYIPDLEEALARDDVHIVCSCVETERRGRIGARCAEAGKHVYLDKPLALNPDDAAKIVAAVKRAGVRTQMYSNIHDPTAQAARQALNRGDIGELRAIHCDVVFAKGHPGSAPVGNKRVEKPNVERYTFVDAKREMFDIGVYAVAMVNWLTRKKVKTVYANTGNYFFKGHFDRDVEDFGAMVLTLEDGVTATVAGGRFGWLTHPQGGMRGLHIVGTQDTLTFDPSKSHLEVFADEPVFQPPPPHPLDPTGMWGSTQTKSTGPPKRQWVSVSDAQGRDEIASFVDCVENGVESEMNAEMAAPSISVITAAFQSAASGKVVQID